MEDAVTKNMLTSVAYKTVEEVWLKAYKQK